MKIYIPAGDVSLDINIYIELGIWIELDGSVRYFRGSGYEINSSNRI